jgi:hypothetical protein
MQYEKNILDEIKTFLPPTAQIALLKAPYESPAIEFIDMDGDSLSEIVYAYYWQGDYYIMLLKYYDNAWKALDIVKGKGYNITYFNQAPITSKDKNNLIVGWQVGAIWSDLSIYELQDKKLKDLVNINKYFSKIEVEDMESTKSKNRTYELALWKHDTGEAYEVEIYRWLDNKLALALDVYPYYFKKVVNYYKKLLKEKDSTTYWYYLADAQIKTGNIEEACKSIEKALEAKYPYPSIERLMDLKKQICGERQISNVEGINFSSINYIMSETKRYLQLEQALKKEFNLEDGLEKLRYYYNEVDLNDDGIYEIFVLVVGPFVCGTGGCSAVIFKKQKGEYKLLSRFSLVRNPVIISNKKTKGYKDIIMKVSGGGIESFFAELKFDGTTYPRNPSVQPKIKPDTEVEGIAIIADDISKNPGIELNNFMRIRSTNQAIIDVKIGNILGQYTHDKVILVGHYLYKDSSYVENVEIVINTEESNKPIITKIPYTGYSLELFLGDFNGDGRDEIMVRGEYGGSGSYAIAAIYQYNYGYLEEIFNPDMFSEKYKFIGKYLEGYKALVQSVTLKEKYIFDISKTPEIYLNIIYDEKGKVIGTQEPIISAINGAYPIKSVFQKNYFLFIRQRVIGVSNADKIGYIESFVDLLNNDIKVIEMGSYHFGEKES